MATYKTSILYKNETKDIFLVDIPASISLAQDPSTDHKDKTNNYEEHPSKKQKKTLQRVQPNTPNKCIISTPPQQKPYSTPPEPKTEKARARVLERIPQAERVFHEDVIAPLVTEGLEVLRREYTRENWCLERVVLGDSDVLGTSFGVSGYDHDYDYVHEYGDGDDDDDKPPVILSSTSENVFGSMHELRGVPVQNPSMDSAVLVIPRENEDKAGTAVPGPGSKTRFIIPPLSTFLLSTLVMDQHPQLQTQTPNSTSNREVITGLPPTQKFNLILLDPPWPNRSVRRSGHYHTQLYTDMDVLTRTIRDILREHLRPVTLGLETSATGPSCMAAIWVTNSYKARMAAYEAIQGAGLVVVEEWAWVKTAANGEAIMPVEGVWRKPYEVLVIGAASVDKGNRACYGTLVDKDSKDSVVRRVVAAVPDVHSRKPNLKEVFEEVFFGSSCYSALEVFARNLTAGWWGCGDEVLKFNSEEWWK